MQETAKSPRFNQISLLQGTIENSLSDNNKITLASNVKRNQDKKFEIPKINRDKKLLDSTEIFEKMKVIGEVDAYIITKKYRKPQ